MDFSGDAAWVIDHRDRTLFRIDARTNTAQLVATIPGDAPERIAFAAGHLWITGRDGTVTASLAASGPLDVHGLVADDDAVWLADNTHGVLYRVAN